MTRRRFRSRTALAFALASSLLGGCAYAPGQWYGKSAPEKSPAEIAAEDVQPVRITFDLIRQLDAQRAAAQINATRLPPEASSEYRLGAGDALQINVWNHADLNTNVGVAAIGVGALGGNLAPTTNVVPQRVVSFDGTIWFPLVGRVMVAGKTLPEVRELLATRLRQFIKEPQLEVEISAFRSQRVFIVSESVPGVQLPVSSGGIGVTGNILPITDVPLRLAEAINRAGVARTDVDLSEVQITRGGERYRVDAERLLYEGDLRQDVLLQHGDIITFPNRREKRVFVLGETQSTRALPLLRGRTSLTDAIMEAGGPNPLSSNAGQVFVMRGQPNSDQPLIYQVDARSPQAMLLADRFVLQPRDIVYIDPTQLVRVGRLLGQIWPVLRVVPETRALGSGN